MKQPGRHPGQALVERVALGLRGFGVQEGDGMIVGVSGGPDSVCLLHCLKSFSEKFPLRLTVAHLDHKLRGAQARQDARFVERLGQDWKIPVTVEAVDVKSIARSKGISLPMAGREARYAMYEREAERTQSRWVALGHTADDQAETVLMRLFRGSGMGGLSAIPPMRAAGRGGMGPPFIIRPLLGTRRDEILRYLKAHGLSSREDPSNRSKTYLRGKVRWDIMPELTARMGPMLVSSLCRIADRVRQDSDFLRLSARKFLARLRIADAGPGLSIRRSRFTALHPAMQRGVLREGIGMVKGRLAAGSSAHLQAAVDLILRGRSGARFTLPGGLSILVSSDRFTILDSASFPKGLRSVPVNLPGETDLIEAGVSLRVSIGAGTVAPDPRRLGLFDLSKAEPPFIVRAWQPGDRFCPAGMKGRQKKLQDYFVDAKIPRHLRARIPILSGGNGILWLIGHRFDERFMAGPQCPNVMRVELRPKGEGEWS